ncbi:MAG: response regulator transcription factor [Rubrobacteraceae bacterium]
MIRVYILASTPMTRAGLRTMVEDAGARVVGEGEDITTPEPTEADVVLVDGDGLLEEAPPDAVADAVAGAVADAVSEGGMQALLAISEDDGPIRMLRALSSGGWGIVTPDAAPEELEAALSAVAEGLVVLPRPLAERVLHSTVAEDLAEPLTNREREVLELLSQGRSNKLIARGLHISEHTVKFHISSLYAKLGVSSRAEAVSQGARYGLLSL